MHNQIDNQNLILQYQNAFSNDCLKMFGIRFHIHTYDICKIWTCHEIFWCVLSVFWHYWMSWNIHCIWFWVCQIFCAFFQYEIQDFWQKKIPYYIGYNQNVLNLDVFEFCELPDLMLCESRIDSDCSDIFDTLVCELIWCVFSVWQSSRIIFHIDCIDCCFQLQHEPPSGDKCRLGFLMLLWNRDT